MNFSTRNTFCSICISPWFDTSTQRMLMANWNKNRCAMVHGSEMHASYHGDSLVRDC